MYLCPSCGVRLATQNDRLVCPCCGAGQASLKDGLVQFDGYTDHENFFEKQALDRLDSYYADYSPERFRADLRKVDLWEMDWPNKRVGIARKFWWEPRVGKIENKKILEIGCGVNYIIPYWLLSKNSVFAFDICKESVVFLKKVIDRVGAPQDKLTLAVADATQLTLDATFDIVNVNNVLHHIADKPAVFRKIRNVLADDGKLLIVEPNYYYPPRWIIETDALDPFNFLKDYFVRNDLIEKGEKAIVFPDMRRQLREAGLKIEATFKDPNYLGYCSIYWMENQPTLASVIFALDRHLFSAILPAAIAPFQYIIAAKA